MKNLTQLLVLCLLSTAPALADEPAAPEAGGQVMADMPEAASASSSGAKVSALYSTAGSGKFTGSAGGVSLSGQDNFKGGAPGLAMEYVQRAPDALGFSAGLAYEASRTMTDFDYIITDGIGSEKVVGSYRDARTLSLIIPAANLNYSFGSSGAYGFAGLNYSLPSFSTTGRDNLKSALGWQMGLGYAASRKVDLELMLQTVNLKYSDGSVINWDSYKMQGLSLRVGYRI